jgi:prepilin-type processing-associated H-X9-DG protein
MVENNSLGISYSYNWMGIATGFPKCPRSIFTLQLGLGHLPRSGKRQPAVLAPSEMYAVADARSQRVEQGIACGIKMLAWSFDGETEPVHGRNYDILFCDGHVAGVKRTDYLYPPRTAANWNSDNQPHQEAWAPRNFLAVQN